MDKTETKTNDDVEQALRDLICDQSQWLMAHVSGDDHKLISAVSALTDSLTRLIVARGTHYQ